MERMQSRAAKAYSQVNAVIVANSEAYTVTVAYSVTLQYSVRTVSCQESQKSRNCYA